MSISMSTPISISIPISIAISTFVSIFVSVSVSIPICISLSFSLPDQQDLHSHSAGRLTGAVGGVEAAAERQLGLGFAWAAAKELNLSYHSPETMSFTNLW